MPYNPYGQTPGYALDPNTGQYVPQAAPSMIEYQKRLAAEEAEKQRQRDAIGPAAETYTPGAAEAMQGSWNEYMDLARQDGPQLGNLADDFAANTTAYNPYEFRNMNDKFMEYAPDDYKGYDYTYGDGYGGITNDAYQFSDPNIEQVEDISGVPAQIWDTISRNEEDAQRRSFDGARAQMAQQMAAGGGGRRGMAAKLTANMAGDEAKGIADVRQQAAIQRAQSELGVRQGTQALKATRGIQQASMLSRAEEMQAAELARKQGIDIEDARYRVGLKKERETAQAGEGRYTYEAGTDRAKYRTGLEQALDESKAAEAEKAYKSNYSREQDITGLQLTEHQQRQQDTAARRQAALSGAEAAQGMFSQVGSYDIQKDNDRNDDYYSQGAQATSGFSKPSSSLAAADTSKLKPAWSGNKDEAKLA